MPLAPVDVCGDSTCSHPPTLVWVPATYGGLITRCRVRELAQGLTEHIILQGNECSPGERENEDMIIDVCVEEREMLEEVGDMMI